MLDAPTSSQSAPLIGETVTDTGKMPPVLLLALGLVVVDPLAARNMVEDDGFLMQRLAGNMTVSGRERFTSYSRTAVRQRRSSPRGGRRLRGSLACRVLGMCHYRREPRLFGGMGPARHLQSLIR